MQQSFCQGIYTCKKSIGKPLGSHAALQRSAGALQQRPHQAGPPLLRDAWEPEGEWVSRGQPLFSLRIHSGQPQFPLPAFLYPRRARRLSCPRPPALGAGKGRQGHGPFPFLPQQQKAAAGSPSGETGVPGRPATIRLLPGAPPTGSSWPGCGYLLLRERAGALLTRPLFCQGKQLEGEGRRSHPSLRTKLQPPPGQKFAAGQGRSHLPVPDTDLCNRTLCTESRSSRFLVTGRGMLYLPAPNIASARGPFIARPTACPAAPATAGGRGQVGALQPARLRRASRAVLEPAGATPRGTGETRPTQLRAKACAGETVGPVLKRWWSAAACSRRGICSCCLIGR